MKTWSSTIMLSKHLHVLPRLETWNHALIPKKEGPKSHSTLTACTTPSVHVFPIFCTRFTPLIITQHTDSLLTLTNAHGMTRDIQVLRFHSTTVQNSHRAFPTSPHSHKSQPRTFFHHKLYTLPKSTSMIPIKCSQNTRFPVVSSLFLSRIPL